MTSRQLLRTLILIALAAATLEARGSQEIRQDVRIATAVAGVPGAPTIAMPMSPITTTGTGLIIGRVIDAGTGRPVGGALVSVGGSAPAPPVNRAVVVNQPGGAPMTFGQPGGGMPRLMTDSEGHFVFRNMPKGSFNLQAQKPGYVDGAHGRLRPNGPSQSLELGDGERLNDVTIRLFRFATISGLVTDQIGEPAVGVQVRAYRRTVAAGRRMLSSTATGLTDDRGMYRLFSLVPGEYIVAVPSVTSSMPASFQMQGRMSPDLLATAMSGGSGEFSIGMGGTPVTSDGRFLMQPGGRGSIGTAPDAGGRLLVHQSAYHPSASTVGQAESVTVGSGEERTGVDVSLKLVPSVSISGRLVGPDGPVESFMLHLTPTDNGEMSTDPDVATAVTASDGSFMFFGVPAGQYLIQTVRAPRPGVTGAATTVITQGGGNMSFTTTMGGVANVPPPTTTEPTLWTATPISLGAEDVRDLTIMLSTGLKVSGRTEFQGTAERPPGDRLAQVAVAVESADGRTRAGPAPGRLQPNGLFTTQGVPPGKYILRVMNPPGGWGVKSIMIGGVDASDTPIDLEDKDLSGALITLTDRISALSGTVKGPQGGPDDAAAVVIFPSDNRAWMNYGTNPRRVRMTRSSKSGTYSFNGLPEGDYYVIAIGEEVAGEWQDPRFLEAMTREATRVAIADGDKRAIDLERRGVRPPDGRFPPSREALRRDFGDDRGAASEGPSNRDEPADSAEVSESPTSITGAQQTRDPRTQTRDRPVEPKPGTGTIAGIVLQDDVSNTPMRRARVTLRRSDSGPERATMTDESGRFSFTALPDGRYTLTAAKAAYLTVYHGAARPGRGPGSPIALSAGQQLTNITVRLPRGGVVTGMITDPFGAPVPNVGVRFMQYQMSGGERRLVPTPASGSSTDDRGVYRAYGLMPGSYVVSVVPPPQFGSEIRQFSQTDLQAAMNDTRQQGALSPSGAVTPPADVPSAIVPGRSVGYAPVYYPGTMVQTEAGQITVAAGQEVTGVDLPIRLVRTSRLEGTVLGADGRPAANSMVMALATDQIGAVSTRSMSSANDGKFSLTNVAPGRYTLIARGGGSGMVGLGERMVFIAAPPGGGPPPGAPPPPPPPPPPSAGGATLYAEQDIDVSGEDITGLSLTLQPGMTVSGRVVFEGRNSTPAPDIRQVRVFLTNASQNRVMMGVPGAQLTETGDFVIEGVPPGQYRLSSSLASAGAPGGGSAWTLKSAVVNGRDTLDTPLEIRPGTNLEGVTMIYTDLVSEISGTLSDGKGKPISDLSILVFTTDRTQWGSTSSRRLRPPIRPSSDGKFSATGLPAGEYYLGAVTDLEPGDWQDPSFLEQLAAAAIKVTIADGEKKVQDIKIAGGQ